MAIVVMPDTLRVVQSDLSTVISVTAIVHARIRVNVTDTTWPSIRLSEINSIEQVERRMTRTSIQVDCWAPPADKDVPNSGSGAARDLAEKVRGALREIAGYEYVTFAVAVGAADLSIRYEPDDSRDPAVPRYVVTGAIFCRPNP